ncbi:unnamed protein product [Cuscuta campestris]|uniref:MADS-box domain-containing protein n=1 Tax=Cuscuta campestris TaxID=132261 RepID=A0A484N9L7_9ASTE|nr:unnamed protein product [Cuscuta campestris]
MGKGKGKSKIEIKKIQSLPARNVAFSKRKKSLFNKAADLCRLYPGVKIAVVAMSPAGNPHVFGDPAALLPPVESQVSSSGNAGGDEEVECMIRELMCDDFDFSSDAFSGEVPPEMEAGYDSDAEEIRQLLDWGNGEDQFLF